MNAVKSVLFVCTRNAVRSPMAAALLEDLAGNITAESAGVEPDDQIDPFVVAVMNELNIDLSQHHGKALEAVKDRQFDLVITLSADAHYRTLLLQQDKNWPENLQIENWIIPNPTDTFGPRDMRVQSYRSVRSLLATKIKERFKA